MNFIRKLWTKFVESRLHLALLLCGGLFCVQFMNASLGFTIMCIVAENMTDSLEYDETFENENISYSVFQHLSANDTSYCGKTHWSSEVQGLVLSALSWGRLTTPLSGWLTDRWDPLYLMGKLSF